MADTLSKFSLTFLRADLTDIESVSKLSAEQTYTEMCTAANSSSSIYHSVPKNYLP